MPNAPGTPFERKLRRALRPYPPADRYLVGVSGGRDSVALLHGLVEAGYRRLVVCHLNHGLRGDEATADAEFVQHLAEGYKLPVEIGAADVRALAGQEKKSLETAAREARYRFFAGVAGRRRCRTLLLAHQADDQAETFLFNLLRGAGPGGLAGMAVESERKTERGSLRIVRPLLAVWREEINRFLTGRNIVWREDATNADPAHGTRNRLRAEGLPQLSLIMGRDVKPALWRAADLLAEEQTLLESLADAFPPLPARVPLSLLTARPVAQQRRSLLAWLRGQGVRQIGYREVELVRSLLDKSESSSKVNLPGGHHARRRSGVLFMEPPARGQVAEDRAKAKTKPDKRTSRSQTHRTTPPQS